MVLETVAVTGGNGKLGRETLSHLGDAGYETVNVARGKRREEVADEYVTTDLLDAGETYGALAKYGADAVIHFGTIPGDGSHPDYRTYESNVMSAAHLLEATDALGCEALCLASSINAIGSEWQRRSAEIDYLPVDEAHPRRPDDSYGVSKHALEVTADAFARRPDNDVSITSLRYPWVANETEIRETFVEADRSREGLKEAGEHTARDVLFSYLHIADAARAARLAVETDFDDHETFWTVADDTTAEVPTAELIDDYYPDAHAKREFEGHEALIDVSKAGELLGWEPEHSWRDLDQ